MIEASLKYFVLRGSFSEMFDSLARIIVFGGHGTSEHTDEHTND